VEQLQVIDGNVNPLAVPTPEYFELAREAADKIVPLGYEHEYSDAEGHSLDADLAERVITKAQPETWLMSQPEVAVANQATSVVEQSDLPPLAKDAFVAFKDALLSPDQMENAFDIFRKTSKRRLALHTYLTGKDQVTLSSSESSPIRESRAPIVVETAEPKPNSKHVKFNQLPPAAGITGNYEDIGDLAPISKDGGARSPSTGRPGLINDIHLKQIADRQDSIRAAMQERFNPGEVKSLESYETEVQMSSPKARRRATREQGIAEERNPDATFNQIDYAKDGIHLGQYWGVEKASGKDRLKVPAAESRPRNYRRSEREADSTAPEPAGQPKSQRIKSVFKKARAALSDTYASAGVKLTSGKQHVGEFYNDEDKGTERRTRTKRILAGALGVVAAGGVGYLTYRGMSGGEHANLITSIPVEQADVITEAPAAPTPPRPEFITENLSGYGDTISHHAEDLFNNHGYNAEYSSASELTDAIQQANGISDQAAHHMAVGAEFKIPTLGGAEQAAAPDTSFVTERLEMGGDTIGKHARDLFDNHGYDQQYASADRLSQAIMDASGQTPESAHHMAIGTEIKIPKLTSVVEAFQIPASDLVETNQAVTESLRALPESNPMTKGELLGLLAVGSSVAAMSQLHRIDDMDRAKKAKEAEDDDDEDEDDKVGKSK